MTYGILLIFIPLLILEAFFAASEIALVSANRRRLHHRAEEGHRDARLALQLLARPEYFLATTLLGAYMAAAVNTVLVTAFFLGLFGHAAEIPVILALPPVILILGEIIPKSIGRQQATLLAERLDSPLRIVHEEFHSQDFTRRGGTLQMAQLWVNLRAKDKSAPPGYQALGRGDGERIGGGNDAGGKPERERSADHITESAGSGRVFSLPYTFGNMIVRGVSRPI